MADIVLRGISKRYGDRTVLDGLDLEIRSGECFTILGPSGCGKTVILRLIAGFEKPEVGTVSIGPRVMADGAKGSCVPPEDRRIGVVFQDYAVWPHMTVRENVGYPLKIAKVTEADAKRRTDAAIAQVNLDKLGDRLPYQLSGGQQQRVALSRALVAEPDVMLLDEPLTNLDANLREEMRFEIKALQRQSGATILYVTHDMEVALAISDRIAVMDEKGRIRQIGTPAEVYESPADEFVFKFLGVANRVDVEVRGGAAAVAAGGAGFPAVPPAGFPEGAAVAGLRPMDVEIRPAHAAGAVPGRITRMTMLGPVVDYLVEFAGVTLRAQSIIEEAIAVGGGRPLDVGAACSVVLHDVKWFPRDAKEAR